MSTNDVSFDPTDEGRALTGNSPDDLRGSHPKPGAMPMSTLKRTPSLLSSPVTVGEQGIGIHPGRGQASIGQVQRVNSVNATQRTQNDMDDPAMQETVVNDSRIISNTPNREVEANEVSVQRGEVMSDSSQGDSPESRFSRKSEPRSVPQPSESANLGSATSLAARQRSYLGNLPCHKGFRSSHVMSDSPSVRVPTTRESLLPDFDDEIDDESDQVIDANASVTGSDFSAIDAVKDDRDQTRASSRNDSQRPVLGWSSDETLSPIASRTTSYMASSGHSQVLPQHEVSNVSRSLVWDTLASIDHRRRPFSEGSPIFERSPSPVRAASVEVLSAAHPAFGVEHNVSSNSSVITSESLADDKHANNLNELSPQDVESLNTSSALQSKVLAHESAPEVDRSESPDAEHITRSHTFSNIVSQMSRNNTGLDQNKSASVESLFGKPMGISSMDIRHQGHSTPPTRPNTGETGSSTISRDRPNLENEVVLDISYEQSFMPPESTNRLHKSAHEGSLMPVDENEEPYQIDRSLKQSRTDAKHPTGPDFLSEAHQATPQHAADVTESEENLSLGETARDVESKALLRLAEIDQNSTFDSPRFGEIQTKPWETPAATKQYMRDAPTRTAISRKVENFQIPPERLSALQPEIAAMQKMVKKPSDKLSLKESSAQIDALLNENWGLKMKIMFMDQHFEHDRDKAELIAENVRLQTNGFNFVQQVRSRDKLIKSLEKQIADLEYFNASGKTQDSTTEIKTDLTNERIVALEDYIERLETEHDERISTMQHKLDVATERLMETERKTPRTQSISHISTELSDRDVQTILVQENQELRQSLADVENELDQRIDEHGSQCQYLNDVLTTREEEISGLRQKLVDISETLRNYELELDESDQMRQDAVEEIRNIYESERLEYEMYIEDRHEEIDNLKQALNCYNQDSFEARLTEAVRPHEEAWKEINQQCTDLQDEFGLREKQWRSAQEALESRLQEASTREQSLQEKFGALQAELQEGHDHLKMLRDERSELDNQLRGLQEQLASSSQSGALTDVVKKLESQIQELETENVACQNEIEELVSKWQAAQDANAALSADIENRMDTVEQLRQDNEDRTREIAGLLSDAEERQNQMDELDRRCQQYQSDIEALHAAIDESKHSYDLQHRDICKQHEHEQLCNSESISSLETKLQSCQTELATLLQGAASSAKELQDIKSYFAHQKTGPEIEHASVMQTVSAVFSALETEKEELRAALTTARSSQDEIALNVRKNQRMVEQMETSLKSMQKRCSDSDALRARTETRSRSQSKDLDELQRKFDDSRREAARVRQSMTDALDHSNALLSNVLAKINSLLSSDQQRGDLPSVLEFGQFQKALQGSVEQLWQQMQHAAGDQKTTDAELRKKHADLEAQLSNRTQRYEKLKTKLDQTRAENDALRRQRPKKPLEQAEKNSVPDTSVHARVVVDHQSGRGFDGSGRKSDALGAPADSLKEDYWTLHERIKALTRDLKYQKELREQDDTAAKTRLFESKKENEDLRKLLEAKDIGPRVLALGRQDSGSRAGSRASHRRIESGSGTVD